MGGKQVKKNIISLFFFVSILLTGLFSCQNRYNYSKILTKAETLKNSNPDSVLILLENIKTPASLNKKQYATYLLLQVEAMDKTDKDLSDNVLLSISIDYFTNAQLHKQTAYAHFYQNRVYQSQNQIELAMESCCLAKNYAEKTTDLNLMGLIYHDLGHLYKEQFNHTEAINSYRKSMEYFRGAKNKNYAIYIQKRIGDIFLASNSLASADSALSNYRKALECAKKDNNQDEIYHAFRSISLSLYEANQFETAKTHIINAIEMDYHSSEIFNDYILLSKIYLALNKLDSANFYLNKASLINEELTLKEKYLYKKMSYSINFMKKDYKSALSDLEDCMEYQNLSHANTTSQKILEIQKKYEKESLENEKNELIMHRLYFFCICLFLIFAILIAAIFIIDKNKKHKSETLKKQQELLLLEEMLDSKNGKENKLKELLIHKLDIVKKVALMKSNANVSDSEFIKQFHKIFSQNISEALEWDNLYPIFDELYNNFAFKLKQAFPSLTAKELQHCCLIRADFTSEEIGLFLSYEYNSVRANKVRLRKKMGFETYEGFMEYINNL